MIIEYTAFTPKQANWVPHPIPGYDAILIGSTFRNRNIIIYDTANKAECPILNAFLDSDSKEKAKSFYEMYGNIFDFHKYLKFYPQMKDYLPLDYLYEQTLEELNIPPESPYGKSDMAYEIFSYELFEYFRRDLFYICELISVLGENPNSTSTDTMESIRENILSLYSNPKKDALPAYLYNFEANGELSLTLFVSYPFYCYRLLKDGIIPDTNFDKLTALCTPKLKSGKDGIELLTKLLNGEFSFEKYSDSKEARELAQKIIADFLSYYLKQNKSRPPYPLNDNDVDTVNDQYPSLIFALYDVVYYIRQKGPEVRHCAYCGKLLFVPATSRRKHCDGCAQRKASQKYNQKIREEQAAPETASSTKS